MLASRPDQVSVSLKSIRVSPCRLYLRSTIPHQISDSIWLRGGSLLVGAGPIMSIYGELTPRDNEPEPESLFEYVARRNGPLEDYNPQMILQCLLWGEHIHILGVPSS